VTGAKYAYYLVRATLLGTVVEREVLQYCGLRSRTTTQRVQCMDIVLDFLLYSTG
jgi:hypothetical protein